MLNDYTYVSDPINGTDLTGESGEVEKYGNTALYCAVTLSPRTCRDMFELGRLARRITVKYFKTNDGTIQGDAFRHIVWFALARRVGIDGGWAMGFGRSYESCGSNHDRRGDLHNNSLGLSLGGVNFPNDNWLHIALRLAHGQSVFGLEASVGPNCNGCTTK